MAVCRSLGDAIVQRNLISEFLDASSWKALTNQIGEVWGSRYLLGTAMAGVGLGTTFSVFKGVGFKPFLVGLAGALLVGLVGLLMALLLGQFVRL